MEESRDMSEAPDVTRGVEAIDRLQFPPPGQRSFPTPLAQLAIFLSLVLGGMAVGLVVVAMLLDPTPVEGPGGSLGFAIFGGSICFLIAVLAVIVLRVRHFQVHEGRMTLVMPRRAKSGKRIRHVLLTEVASVEPIAESGFDPGVWVTLRDGTRFPIFEGELPHGGGHFLDQLTAAVNRRRSTSPPNPHVRTRP